MAEIYRTPREETYTSVNASGGFAQRIAHQDGVIEVLEQRLIGVQQQRGYSFTERQDEYAIQRALAAASDERATLLYGRNATDAESH